MNYSLMYKLSNDMNNATMAAMLEACDTTKELLKKYNSFPDSCKKSKWCVDAPSLVNVK